MSRLEAIVAELKAQITVSEDARVQKINDIAIITKYLSAPPTLQDIAKGAYAIQRAAEEGYDSPCDFGDAEGLFKAALQSIFPEGEKV